MANRQPYSRLKKGMRYPKGLKDWIVENTDYSYRVTNVSRYVHYIEMFKGKPLRRVFAYRCDSKVFLVKEFMLVKEVARYYDGNQFLGDISASFYSGAKKVYYDGKANRFVMYNNHEWDLSGYMMTDIDQFLIDNNLLYTGWHEYDKTATIKMSFDKYITKYLENPKIELLSKAGLGKWVNYLRYLDTSKKNIHEIFKIREDCVKLLYQDGFGLHELLACRKEKSNDIKKIGERVWLEAIKKQLCTDYRGRHRDIEKSVMNALKQDKTVYYIQQLAKNKHHNWNWLLTNDYTDYLINLNKLGAITDPKALYPADFKKAHDKVAKEVRVAESEKLIAGFIKQYKKYQKYEYKDANFTIKVVSTPEELFTESEKLNHCVRTYAERVANGETEILFIRKNKRLNTPFYTLELQKKKVVQVRGKNNKAPDDDVRMFIADWSKKYKLRYV